MAELDPAAAGRLSPRIRKLQDELQQERERMERSRQNAENFEMELNELSRRDDRLDLAEGSFSIAMAILAMTALTRRAWLFWLAAGLTGLGLVCGLTGW